MDHNIYSAMQTEEPIARFKKTILGKVHVLALNPFSGEAESVILEGDPAKSEDGTYIEIWNDKSLMFLRKMNRAHFDEGRLSDMTKEPAFKESPNQITDEEIDEVLNKPFLALDKKLLSFTAEAPILRFLTRARELEKSEKIVKRIQEALDLVQQG